MKVHVFEVEINSSLVEKVDLTLPIVRYTANVTLGGVVLYSEDVTRIMATSAPTRQAEAESQVLAGFATKLKGLLE